MTFWAYLIVAGNHKNSIDSTLVHVVCGRIELTVFAYVRRAEIKREVMLDDRWAAEAVASVGRGGHLDRSQGSQVVSVKPMGVATQAADGASR